MNARKVLVVGCGVAGSEAGTVIGHKATFPIEVIEIEAENSRRFGGWGFQRFPETECTNLAMRKMFLGDNPDDILIWSKSKEARASWPLEYREMEFDSDQPFPRVLMQEYVKWRRDQVHNNFVSYRPVSGEVVKVTPKEDGTVEVLLKSGKIILADRVLMASGSISVKVPPYLEEFKDHNQVIIDPLVIEGHQRRAQIPKDARVLILGTGLTGEEQVNVLLKSAHTKLTLLSRGGQRHFNYPAKQLNVPLVLDTPPDFLHAETPEDFNFQLSEFFAGYLKAGHSHEDILQSIRPHWNQMRAELGGCKRAATRLKEFRRILAVNSIGTSWEVSENTRLAEASGNLIIASGHITKVCYNNGVFDVDFSNEKGGSPTHTGQYDFIINAIGRNIIRHPVWDNLLQEGFAKKHAGIGVRVSEIGQLINAEGTASNLLWVLGMARAGDHALRHGYLGNSAFNVPQVRSHLYQTITAMLDGLK